MNISQAKAVAAIPYRLRSRADFERAELDCKSKIIAARRANDADRAAALSEAKEFFKRRARAYNTCPKCGATIARGAAHCRICSRGQIKAIASPVGIESQPTKPEKRNGNARVFIPGNELAALGYYSKTVQKVLARWRGKISEETLDGYFSAVATSVILNRNFLELQRTIPPKPQSHWLAVFELGAAVVKVLDKGRPHAWLLGGEVVVNGQLQDWEAVRAKIKKNNGPDFSARHLSKVAHELKLSVPKETAKSYRQFVVTKTG